MEWVALPFLQGDFPDPEMEPGSPALQADSVPSEPPGNPHHEDLTPQKALPLVAFPGAQL